MINKRFFKTKDEVEVTFELSATQVRESVSIVADLSGWQPMAMKKSINQIPISLKRGYLRTIILNFVT